MLAALGDPPRRPALRTIEGGDVDGVYAQLASTYVGVPS
jgi:hypothetical protein